MSTNYAQAIHQLMAYPPDQERRSPESVLDRSEEAKQACRHMLLRFPNLCKFFQMVLEELGRKTLRKLWCRIWGALKKEWSRQSRLIEEAFYHMVDPEDRAIDLRRAAKSGKKVVVCVQALEELVA